MRISLITLLLAFSIIALPNLANAVEGLNYSDEISTSLKPRINQFLKQTYETDLSSYNLAKADLNGDGLDEYILKRKQCNAKNNLCTHLIIAATEDEIMLLNNIRARNLMIGATSTHGISDLLAFKNDVNDYNFDIYIWSPTQKMYILKTQ